MSTSVGRAGAVARYLDRTVPPDEHPGAFVAAERERLGPVRAAEQHRVAPHAAVGGDGESARRRRSARARRRYASAPTSGWSASPTTPPSTDVVGRRARATRPAGSTRCRARARRCARPRRSGAALRVDRRRDPVVGRPRRPPARSPLARAASTACATSGRPRSDEQRLGRVAAEAQPAAGGEHHRGASGRSRGAQSASSARRTSTRARCSRYSADALRSARGSVPSAACSAASAADAPCRQRRLDRGRAQRRGAHVDRAPTRVAAVDARGDRHRRSRSPAPAG